MSEPYQALAKREKVRADKLSQQAHAAGMSALSSSLVVVSTKVVKIVMKNDGRGSISEPSQDLIALRTNTELLAAKERDLYRAEIVVKETLLAALADGYEYDARERAKVIVTESTGLQISVEVTEQELRDLEHFPISGLSANEWALRASRLLSDAVDQALAKPLTGAFDAAAIPGLLSNAAYTHANGLASLTREAFFAGGKAAMLAIREALSGH